MAVDRQFFEFEHLPEHLQDISRPMHSLMTLMDANLPACAEKEAGMRKLLEAKDCFVRARVQMHTLGKNTAKN